MGICISVESSEIHGIPQVDDENVMIFEANNVQHETKRLGSVYSKQGTKGINQDSASIHKDYGIEDGAFCGVYDGHGRNGHIVSKIVNNSLPSLILSQKNAFEENGTSKNSVDKKHNQFSKNFLNLKEAIISAFNVMDKEVKQQENLDCSCSGTTAVVVIRQGEGLLIANLGDSRAILGTIHNAKLEAIQLTTDLKPGLPCEATRIRSCNGRVYALKEESHVQRIWLPNEDYPGLAMSRAFGDFILKDHGVIAIPDIYYHPLTSSDLFIVLASDGVWDVLSNEEVASIVWMVESEDAAAKAVVEAATAAWAKKYPSSRVDDCTVACLFLQTKLKNMGYKQSGKLG